MSSKLDINALNKVFENRIRLGVMSLLLVNDKLDFNSLKDQLDVTDGNLASHLSALEKNNYVSVTKQFVGKKPRTTYKVTESGRKAFMDHLSVLEHLINMR